MTSIYYERTNGMHDFYLSNDGKDYYLFSQAMKRSVDIFYRGRINLDKALCHGIGKRDHAVHHTMDKLKTYIRYIEMQHDIIILNRTYKKSKRAA